MIASLISRLAFALRGRHTVVIGTIQNPALHACAHHGALPSPQVDTAVIGTIQEGSGGFTFGTTALLRGLRLRGVRAAPSWNDLVNAANARDAQAIAQRCVRSEEARIVPATKCRAR